MLRATKSLLVRRKNVQTTLNHSGPPPIEDCEAPTPFPSLHRPYAGQMTGQMTVGVGYGTSIAPFEGTFSTDHLLPPTIAVPSDDNDATDFDEDILRCFPYLSYAIGQVAETDRAAPPGRTDDVRHFAHDRAGTANTSLACTQQFRNSRTLRATLVPIDLFKGRLPRSAFASSGYRSTGE